MRSRGGISKLVPLSKNRFIACLSFSFHECLFLLCLSYRSEIAPFGRCCASFMGKGATDGQSS